jgi:hypothetical protein
MGLSDLVVKARNHAINAFNVISPRMKQAGAWGDLSRQYAQNAWKASGLTRKTLAGSGIMGAAGGAVVGTAESYYNYGSADPNLIAKRALQGAGIGAGHSLIKGAAQAGVFRDVARYGKTQYRAARMAAYRNSLGAGPRLRGGYFQSAGSFTGTPADFAPTGSTARAAVSERINWNHPANQERAGRAVYNPAARRMPLALPGTVGVPMPGGMYNKRVG